MENRAEARRLPQLGRRGYGPFGSSGPAKVKGVLKPLLAGRRPALRDGARELRLSVRTLQRRLTGERTTCQRTDGRGSKRRTSWGTPIALRAPQPIPPESVRVTFAPTTNR